MNLNLTSFSTLTLGFGCISAWYKGTGIVNHDKHISNISRYSHTDMRENYVYHNNYLSTMGKCQSVWVHLLLVDPHFTKVIVLGKHTSFFRRSVQFYPISSIHEQLFREGLLDFSSVSPVVHVSKSFLVKLSLNRLDGPGCFLVFSTSSHICAPSQEMSSTSSAGFEGRLPRTRVVMGRRTVIFH